MASYPVFSGDMAALNQGFAAQEDAAIRARAANQNYLAALTGQYQQARTARGAQELGMRGLDVQESLGTRGLDLQSRDQNARNAAALLALSNQQTRDLAAIDNEGRRLSILASQGDRQAQLEADRLALMREQIQAQSTLTREQLRSAEKIAAISSGRLPPNVAIQTMRINEDIKAQNDLAAATAARAQEGITVDTAWFGNNSLKIKDVLSRAKDAWSGMTAEERMLVNYNPNATDPTKVFTAKNKDLLPTSGPQYTEADLRDQPGQGTGSTVLDILKFAYRNFDLSGKPRPAESQPAPGAAPGAPAGDGKPGSGAKPISFKDLIKDSGNQFTNLPPSGVTNPPPAGITNQAPAGMTNQLAAVEGLPAVQGIDPEEDFQGPAQSAYGQQPNLRQYLGGFNLAQQVPANVNQRQTMRQYIDALRPAQQVPAQSSQPPDQVYTAADLNSLSSYYAPPAPRAAVMDYLPSLQQLTQYANRPASGARLPAMDYLPSLQLLTQQAQQATTNTFNPNGRY